MGTKGDWPRPNPKFATNFEKVERVIDWDYRNYIKEMPCLVNNDKCISGVEPHHVRIRTRGAGCHDRSNLVPLCRIHHTECNTIWRFTFEDKYKLGDLRMRAENIQHEYDQTH